MTSPAPTAPRSHPPGGLAPVLVRDLLTCVSLTALLAALAQGLFLIWSVGEMPGDTLWLVARGFLLTAIVAFALAQAALVLRLDVAPPSTAARVRTDARPDARRTR